MKNIVYAFLASSVLFCFELSAQNKKDFVRQGNSLYKKAEYPVSDSLYTMALAIDSTYTTALYNLGNASYLGGNTDVAKAAWMRSLSHTLKEIDKADILYNIAGAEMDKKNYAEAIKLYKDALRRNPSDENARYNLALAQELLKQQQQNQDQQDQNKDQKDQKDQDKDQQDQDKDQQDQNKNQQDQNKDQQKQQKPQISPNAEQMLRAIAREEQKTQEKQKGEKTQGIGRKTGKDW